MIAYRKPAYWLTVGDALFCFQASKTGNRIVYEAEVVQEPVIKEIGITPLSSESKIYASGKVYDIVQSRTGATISLSAVALSSETERKALGTKASGAYVYDTAGDLSKEFAFGYWADLSDGSKVYYWHPCCKLSPASELTQRTSQDDAQEPSVTYTINAMPAANGVWRVRYYTNMVPDSQEPLTVDEFFAAPVYELDNSVAEQIDWGNIKPVAALPASNQDKTAIYVLTEVDGDKAEGTMWRYVDSAWTEYIQDAS